MSASLKFNHASKKTNTQYVYIHIQVRIYKYIYINIYIYTHTIGRYPKMEDPCRFLMGLKSSKVAIVCQKMERTMFSILLLKGCFL